MATAKKIDTLSAGYAEQRTQTAGAQVHASGKKIFNCVLRSADAPEP